VGPGAFFTLRAKKGEKSDRVRAFGSVKAAAAFLKDFLQAGDLVVLKGSNTSDHLVRILLARSAKVACWQSHCGRMAFCDTCALVTVPSEPESGELVPITADAPRERVEKVPADGTGPHIIVGLGNPDPGLVNTPHSVGHAAVDSFAEKLGAVWRPEEGAPVAVGEWDGEPVRLVKLNAWMNHSGPALRALGQRLGFSPDQCILIYDDLDLPLGSLRARASGSDGDHLGLRSILEAFQTDKFRRVKVGVKRAGAAHLDKERVLAPFSSEDRAIIDAVFPQAFDRVLSQIHEARRAAGAVTRAPGATRTASS
jgi:PTH1 family peptidyl-tRNA hydrolase